MTVLSHTPDFAMKTWVLSMFFVACLAPAALQADDLDWLVGCWENTDRTSKEVWVRGTDGSLLGFAVSLSEGQVGFYEILRIYRDAAGSLAYAAHPMGSSPTVFTESASSSEAIVFTNAAHDYPQEIAYRREGVNLLATISALDGANPRSFDKTRCE